MDVKLLRTMIVLSETLHFGLAAERLRIAQPHVSRRIRQLEEDLGVALFERHNRNVKLTEAGVTFAAEARAVLKTLDLARRRTRDAALGRSGKLYVSVVGPAMQGVIVEILAEFRRRCPDVNLSISEHIKSTESHLEVLRDSETDIIFSHPPQRIDPGIDGLRLVRDPFLAVLAQSHPLASRARLQLSELARDPWVFIPRSDDPRIYDNVISLCRRAGFSPNIRQEAGPVQIRLGLVASGYGVQLLRSSWASIPYPGVVYIPISPTIPLEIFCYWKQGNRNPILKHMVDIARKHQI